MSVNYGDTFNLEGYFGNFRWFGELAQGMPKTMLKNSSKEPDHCWTNKWLPQGPKSWNIDSNLTCFHSDKKPLSEIMHRFASLQISLRVDCQINLNSNVFPKACVYIYIWKNIHGLTLKEVSQFKNIVNEWTSTHIQRFAEHFEAQKLLTPANVQRDVYMCMHRYACTSTLHILKKKTHTFRHKRVCSHSHII